ncbi:rRNA maturation RNase YbeY [Bizionia gelidisalsuginis]|uniref:Endoribonuclease YbeY n=2 Tax=Bizionia TaxID=283785 RepID=A0A8H2LD36_9FLAO|nr:MULTISPECIES: rRNA maturation RNase YbeY [Bizionia]TYB74171.1 rRNA maturation RNase YbeY [Bizionia saleffrena]TYC15626.1 rRNA maturation RNase YbeY [Bizionia gelidisalsuginis]
MINFNYENDFTLDNEQQLSDWIARVVAIEKCEITEINYIFCDDDYLHKLNVEFLEHDTLTDVIGFDYSIGKNLQGDIYISTERVADNAKDLLLPFEAELQRVIVHGILHFCGYKDKTESDAMVMTTKENEHLTRLS